MLRRVERTGSSESWILVPQIEHARLAGGLADSWIDDALRAIEPSDELIKAVGHHDDGWADWDASPDVDPASGRPLSFVELPLASSIDIWRRSIYLACSRGYLAAHVVSAHFTALLQKSSPRWSLDPRQFQISREFLNEQSEHRETWFVQWLRPNPVVRTRPMVDLALAYLQMFDALSLWLCAAPRSLSQEFATPAGYKLSIEPLGENRFTARPWPFRVPRWTWNLNARRIPVGRYASREVLAAGPSEQVEMTIEVIAES